eukprot:1754368-Pyramimonas_sp.AAC.1
MVLRIQVTRDVAEPVQGMVLARRRLDLPLELAPRMELQACNHLATNVWQPIHIGDAVGPHRVLSKCFH